MWNSLISKISFVIILLCWGAGVFAEQGKPKEGSGQLLAEMEDGAVTAEEFRKRIDHIIAEGSIEIKDIADRERLLDELISTRLFVREARLLKLPERSDVATDMNNAIDNVLAGYYLKEQVISKIRVTEEEIKAYIEKNQERF